MPKAQGNKARKISTAKLSTTQQVLEHFPATVATAIEALPTLVLQRFVAYYCGEARGNGTLAAQLVGIRGTYSGQACWASLQMRRTDVRAAVDAWMQAFGLTAVEITARITDLTEVNPGPFFEVNKDGKLALREKLDPNDWEAHKHWVKTIRTDGDGHVIEVELHDKMAALRELAKINKLYSDAPIFAFHLHLQQMSDGELLRQLEEARLDESEPQQPRLIGPPVAVVD